MKDRRSSDAVPSRTQKEPRVDFLISAILTTFSFLIYIFTMCRSIPPIDGGELTTVLWTLGIAHPTGYPPFTLLGYLFVHIPILSEVAARANLFAALCTSVAAGIFYMVFVRTQRVLGHQALAPNGRHNAQKGAKEPRRISETSQQLLIRWSSAIAGLVLAFSSTFWDQSTSVEVYPLQLVLFGLIMLMWLDFYTEPVKSRSVLAGLALGLGFTNHMTTILTLPALIYLSISCYRQRRFNPRLFAYIVAGGIAASLLYLYLPIRASQSPLMDWGNPDSLKRFIWHVTGKQFSTWMFSSFEVFRHQLGKFFTSLYDEFSISILVVLLGIVISVISYRRLFWWAILLIAGDLFYAANYNIHDISNYFLLSYISLALFGAVGFRFILERLTKGPSFKTLAIAMLVFFPAVSAAANFSRVNESDDYSVEMYTRDILTSLPRNSIVLSFQWDDFVSASLYYQHIDNLRPDIVVIDKELLRRSWYAAQLHRRYSFLFPADDPIYDTYQANLRLFENGLSYNPNNIESAYSNFIREIILGALHDGREVFVGPEIENQYLYGFNKIPFGLLFELTNDTNYVAYNAAGLNGFRAAMKVKSDYSKQILGFYTQMFLTRAQYEYSFRHLRRTLSWLDKALEVDPTLQAAQTARIRVMKELRSK